jgi:hypothetical protein
MSIYGRRCPQNFFPGLYKYTDSLSAYLHFVCTEKSCIIFKTVIRGWKRVELAMLRADKTGSVWVRELGWVASIIAHYVYYDHYKIDRNKQSKITDHETDILNSHFTEHFYRQLPLTAVEQITFHDTKIKHFTQTNIQHSRLIKIPFPTH